MTPLLVIVSGAPGSGKTTLAKRLGAALGLPVFDRDDFKDAMFDTIGWSDREWSIKVGRASFEILYLVLEELLSAGVSLIAETTFGPQSSERLRAIRDRSGCAIVEVHCSAPPEVVARRFRDRWDSGGRHPGHVAEELLRAPEMGERFIAGHPAIELDDNVIEVDTTDPEQVDLDHIVRYVRSVCDGPEDR